MITKLLDYNKTELIEIVAAYKQEKFRAEQLFTALHNGKDYDDKMNLPKSFLNTLKENEIILQPAKIIKEKKSKSDKSTKFLFELFDGNLVEGMLMQYKFGSTICISTQVGCKMNCLFCASGLNGFVRSLSVGEMLGQVIAVNKSLGGTVKKREITNVVLMGGGEPLDNYANVLKFLQIITSDDSFNFSVRNISVSTCGIPHKIETLADSGFPVTLSVSLHAPTDAIRKKIMPIAKSYPINAILESAKYYNLVTNRRVVFEYTLIEGVNNRPADAKALAELLKDFPCHVNLIRLNEVTGRDFKAPTVDSCKKFLEALQRMQISATLRRTLGDDVEGACGQLKNRVKESAKKE